MKILITRHFGKWAKKQRINFDSLKEAAYEVIEGKTEANLGGELYKKRLAIPGKGKRGAIRTILFFKRDDKLIYIHGFKKNEKSNISPSEHKLFKSLADIFRNTSAKDLTHAIQQGDFEELLNA